MGYSTEFEGQFNITPALDPELRDYLVLLAGTRRMKRDPEKIMEIYHDWEDWCLDGELGEEGEFFAHDDGHCGQDHDESILEYNYPPSTQPGLWCQWIPTEDGTAIEWDLGEKFYEYEEWIRYLIERILEPRGYTLNGEVYWYGEDREDIGVIRIDNNHIDVSYGHVDYD